MAKPAVAIREIVANPPAEQTSVFRDFSQPWLDLNDKSVLVTGGTGSFDKHFLKTVVEQYKPHRLIILSRDENKQSESAEKYATDE